MALSMYDITVPNLVRSLGNLRALLEKAAAHSEARKLDTQALTSFRLYPDMLPLSFQVQIACDIAKGCVARLAGIEAPKFADEEKSLPELITRVERTIEFLRSAKPAQIENTESKAVVLKTPRGDLNFDGQTYAQFFVLPNVYFHVATAYNILRHNGVEIGKLDFLGKP